jgi:hydroxyacylglutathione hydrolase
MMGPLLFFWIQESLDKMQIHQLPAFSDNFIYVLSKDHSAVVIDPGEESNLLPFLEERELKLETLMITHHHPDHIGAVRSLVKRFSCKVIGSAKDSRIPCVTEAVKEGDKISVLGEVAQAFEVDGHTIGHMAYYFPQSRALFSGDLIFSLGCGKLFEGSPQQMWKSLERMRNLPEETLIYGSHEYTLENSQFALAIDPANKNLQAMVKRAKEKRDRSQFTVPTFLRDEKACNPFLRPEFIDFQKKFGLEGKPLWETFAALRAAKDRMDKGEKILF